MQPMRKIELIIFCLSFSNLLFAQSEGIFVSVSDKKSHSRILKACVTLRKNKEDVKQAYSDSNGCVKFVIDTGRYEIKVSRKDYEDYRLKGITVKRDAYSYIEVLMHLKSDSGTYKYRKIIKDTFRMPQEWK